jgi:hypothetical protein
MAGHDPASHDPTLDERLVPGRSKGALETGAWAVAHRAIARGQKAGAAASTPLGTGRTRRSEGVEEAATDTGRQRPVRSLVPEVPAGRPVREPLPVRLDAQLFCRVTTAPGTPWPRASRPPA